MVRAGEGGGEGLAAGDVGFRRSRPGGATRGTGGRHAGLGLELGLQDNQCSIRHLAFSGSKINIDLYTYNSKEIMPLLYTTMPTLNQSNWVNIRGCRFTF
jgi:hypothetical protein